MYSCFKNYSVNIDKTYSWLTSVEKYLVYVSIHPFLYIWLHHHLLVPNSQPLIVLVASACCNTKLSMQMLLQHCFLLPHCSLFHNNVALRIPCAFRFGHAKCSMTKSNTTQSSQISHHDHLTSRQFANYKPSIWSYDFVQSLKTDHNPLQVIDRLESTIFNQDNIFFSLMSPFALSV